VRVVIQRLDDGVMAKRDLLSLMNIAREVVPLPVPGVTLDQRVGFSNFCD
jgi:hypothetical protein